MLRCKTVEILYDVLPISVWRGFLIRRHIDSCHVCQKKILSLEETGLLLVGPLDPDECSGLKQRLRSWAASEAAVRATYRRRNPKKILRWAPSAAMLLVLAATGVWLLREDGKGARVPAGPRPADRFELDYIRVGGRPAGAYIYQPQGADMIIIWAEKAL